MASWRIALVLLAFLAPLGSSGETCVGAKPVPDIYSTRNILLSTETVFIVEFSLKCNNNVKGVTLYAEVNGKVLPVTVSSDDAKYQVSWAESHKEAKSAIYTLSFYDEAGYAAYRKLTVTWCKDRHVGTQETHWDKTNKELTSFKMAQRSGSENEARPLFTVDIDHKGAGREGLYVQTEFIAVVAALLIWWSANNVKSKLQES